jgi:hypothetical protein
MMENEYNPAILIEAHEDLRKAHESATAWLTSLLLPAMFTALALSSWWASEQSRAWAPTTIAASLFIAAISATCAAISVSRATRALRVIRAFNTQQDNTRAQG